ncbi:MAG: CrcB family protein [Opitutales bacterium]|nr:CrcB family protein [Opitutales bacterium]
MLAQIFLCAAAGAIASALRFVLSKSLDGGFPAGTLLANVLATLALALFISRGNLSPATEAFVIAGFCGALSTFSSFAFQVLEMLQKRRFSLAALYIALTFSICLGVCGAVL